MAEILDIPTFSDDRGALAVIERWLPFTIRRVYYIYDVKGKRGGHRHIKTTQLLVAVKGHCEVYVNDGLSTQSYVLNNPSKGLLLDARDWHTMQNFSSDCVLLVLASEEYDRADYIEESYDD